MSLDILSTTRIIVKEQVNDWTEAITIASQPLLQEQIIEQGYVQAMIDSVNELDLISLSHLKLQLHMQDRTMTYIKLV